MNVLLVNRISWNFTKYCVYLLNRLVFILMWKGIVNFYIPVVYFFDTFIVLLHVYSTTCILFPQIPIDVVLVEKILI